MYIKLSHLALAFGFLLLIDYIHTKDHVRKKLKGKKKGNSHEDKTKQVSSDRVPNGGRRGPMGRTGQNVPNAVSIPLPIIPVTSKTKSNKKKKQQNDPKDTKTFLYKGKTKKVSSDRVPNGGRKGPTSGAKSGQGVPNPIYMPLPLIPKKTKSKSKKKKQKQSESNKETSKTILPNSSKTQKSSNGKQVKLYKSNVDKTLIRSQIDTSLTRLKRSDDTDDDDDDDGDEGEIRTKILKQLREKQTKRFKRTLHEYEDDELSDEQRQLAEDWVTEDDDDELIPEREHAYFSTPTNLDFIFEGHSILSDAYNSLMPQLTMYKRSLDDENDYEEPNDDLMSMNKESEKQVDIGKRDIEEEVGLGKRDIEDDDKVNLMLFNAAAELERKIDTRDVNEDNDDDIDGEENEEELDIVNEDADFEDMQQEREARDAAIADEPMMSVSDAEKELENAEKAASALTQLEIGIGIDPEHLVTDTHKYVTSLQAEKSKYDEDIRSHIEKAQDAEKRASIAVHDEISKKSEISKDVAAAKRQLDNDRRKIEEINTELKQLKDIELMATGLEVAKYMAKERARHNLEVAQSKAQITRPQQAPIMQPVSQINQPIVAPMPQQMVPLQPPIVAASPPAPILHEPIPSSMVREPLGASTVIPSFGTVQSHTTMYEPTPSVQMHEMANQRHTDARPAFNTPLNARPTFNTPLNARPAFNTPLNARPTFNTPLNQLPLTQYFSNYLQSKNQMQNQFASSITSSQPNPFAQHVVTHPNFVPYRPPVAETYHTSGDQRHNPVHPPITYMLRPVAPSIANSGPVVTSFAKVPRPKNVGSADHEITKIEQTHSSNNEQKHPDESHDDNNGVLWFPGSTYSPPPSWNHHQNAPAPDMRTQPARNPYYSSPPGQTYNIPSHSNYFPHQSSVPLAEALTAISPVHQYAQQSSLSSAPVSAAYATAQPPPPIAPVAPLAQPYIPSHTYQSSIFPESNMEMRPGAAPIQPYAQQGAKAGQVITEFPPDEVVTMNKKPPPPPPQQPQPDMSGTLPGWMGAVDSAKYENDVSDRLREKDGKKTNNNNNAPPPADNDNPNVKREYLRLINAEDNLSDVQKASNAVTHVESSIGFDPGSIAKMVDFVKTAAKKDVTLSQDAVDKDKKQLQKIQGVDDLVKKSDIPNKPDITKKSEVDSVALEHAKSKLKTDEAVLADAKDRLDKVNKMELIVTEIEVAKFYASMKAEKEVQGAKRTLEALKRNDVTRPQ